MPSHASVHLPRQDSHTDWSSQPLASPGALISRIENLLASMISALSLGEPMSIDLLSRKSLRSLSCLDGQARRQQISFPGKTLAEAQKFTRVLLILQLSHDALVSGGVLTKRQIFYQYQDLFDKQKVVDDLVDDIALTLGVHRHDLNIVASAKGLLSGCLSIRLTDGSTIDTSVGDVGTPIPSLATISAVDCTGLRWILVVEKDATFRSLVSSCFYETSAAGPGLLVTAKGYPDLVTRLFLRRMHQRHAHLPILLLTDLDPDGLNIFRCYRFGTDFVAHDAAAYNPGIRWLGIKTRHVQDAAHQFNQSQRLTPSIVFKTSISSTGCRDPISHLTARDRKLARHMLARITSRCPEEDAEAEQLKLETQTMLMMNVKAEMQWLDDAGDLISWLDEKLVSEVRVRGSLP
ncbi:hypothetical protein XA68_12357 [Ophiocordyceps unilateralis]|uniref:DNA topoisomerase (ATP-hydrolyzing) n=1 Tax=Ophiocordyceps unilateralis TaxID=268505 RepID=A0A2A9PUW1_OPHUN|nr:hypothetical protein XA68_12357 [Ophiocordyceps unilateralis]